MNCKDLHQKKILQIQLTIDASLKCSVYLMYMLKLKPRIIYVPKVYMSFIIVGIPSSNNISYNYAVHLYSFYYLVSQLWISIKNHIYYSSPFQIPFFLFISFQISKATTRWSILFISKHESVFSPYSAIVVLISYTKHQ